MFKDRLKLLDWKVYPNSIISKIPFQLLRKCALLIRNIIILCKGAPYIELINREYSEAVNLAVWYIHYGSVSGDIVEFGTHGLTASVICDQLASLKMNRSLHLFDSFEGFPEATEPEDLNSFHIKSGEWPEGGSSPSISPDELKVKLAKKLSHEQVKIYAGWYEDTLSQIPEGSQFAMLLMDCCLFASHYQVLTHIFKHKMVSEGAIILFSDWNANKASLDFGSRKAWEKIVNNFNILYSNNGTYCWGGQKFIVHSYG